MLEHGKPWRLSPRVRRLVAPNPGAMTGPGTNTYLLGDEDVIVLDPGPAIDSHIDAILAAGDGRIRYIVCTHTHPDHSPAWKAVAEATGAQVIGALPEGDDHQDETFSPDVTLEHEYRLKTPELSLLALHTPGHVSNHYCFLLEDEGMLFAGDHVMNGSTVVIIPPGGDMQAYIAALKMLLEYPVACIAPGHGEVIQDSRAEIEGLVKHRLAREAKVLQGLVDLGSCDLDVLVQRVYDDVDPGLHPWAKLSMEAHLIKLEREGRALRSDDQWKAA
ncbi:MBL fold metallo-hydrolase [Congregibacter litoralis]|uniref:Zn-dependent hydrolase n=1 Tax=Congregibacter litoralis KT71 TaxID=314285 RepID=A4A5N0_9GAMM|nr:MBL fold metallo-hydrolase [Congregibacter litoralis]EAQ98327.1 Zn-dependent hydrolase [Congregibacter litoralis KT71]